MTNETLEEALRRAKMNEQALRAFWDSLRTARESDCGAMTGMPWPIRAHSFLDPPLPPKRHAESATIIRFPIERTRDGR